MEKGTEASAPSKRRPYGHLAISCIAESERAERGTSFAREGLGPLFAYVKGVDLEGCTGKKQACRLGDKRRVYDRLARHIRAKSIYLRPPPQREGTFNPRLTA